MSETTLRLRGELADTLERLEEAQSDIQRHLGTIETLSRQKDVESRRVSDLTIQLNTAQKRNTDVFERRNFEAMNRQQLVSLIEQAINEARRKGMIEAEGLLTRHRELDTQTDLELMRGVVKSYQERIAQVEMQQREEASARQTKIDTRPLGEKFKAQFPTPSTTTATMDYVAPGWWRVDNVPTLAAIRREDQAKVLEARRQLTGVSSTYADLDAKAKRLALGIGATVTVAGSSGGTYVLDHPSERVYSCSCPAWRFQRVAPELRTCKHLETYLGVGHEATRTTKARQLAEAQPQQSNYCWCGLFLLRGQCQIHTQDWKGSENCTCGRAFASCKAAHNSLSIAQRGKGHQPRVAERGPNY